MRQQEWGILLEKDHKGIVFTQEGDFCLVPTSEENIGAKVLLSAAAPKWWLTVAVAAALAAIFTAIGYYSYFSSPVAYVALDINPSLELGIDRKERVANVNLLNEDARRIAEGLRLHGMAVSEAVAILLTRAEELRYLKTDRPCVVLLTVIPVKQSFNESQMERLADSAVRQLKNKNLPAKLVTASVPASVRQEARRAGISAGRYALKDGAVTMEELKRKSLTQIESRNQAPVEETLKAGKRNKVIAAVKLKAPGNSAKQIDKGGKSALISPPGGAEKHGRNTNAKNPEVPNRNEAGMKAQKNPAPPRVPLGIILKDKIIGWINLGQEETATDATYGAASDGIKPGAKKQKPRKRVRSGVEQVYENDGGGTDARDDIGEDI
jgi:hypothetical protein